MLDGLFSLISFAMGLLSLKVARLVRQPNDEHYQFGYASFEPFVNVTKGFIMAFVGVFALYSSIDALSHGGRPIASGYAALYAVFGAAVCLLIARRQRKVADASGSPLVEVDAALPAQLQWLVRKCLAKSPANRYQGAGDLAVDLKQLVKELESGSTPSYQDLRVTAKPRRRWVWPAQKNRRQVCATDSLSPSRVRRRSSHVSLRHLIQRRARCRERSGVPHS